MNFKGKITPEAAQTLKRFSPELKRALRDVMDAIVLDPYSGKALQDKLEGFWSFRYKRYRIIYKIDPKRRQIAFMILGHRASIYEQFERLIMAAKQDL